MWKIKSNSISVAGIDNNDSFIDFLIVMIRYNWWQTIHTLSPRELVVSVAKR